MDRAWDFIKAMLIVVAFDAMEKKKDGTIIEPLGTYVFASVLRKSSLPKRPNGIEVSTRFRRSMFTLVLERVDD